MFHVRCRNQISCVAFALSTRNPLELPVLDIEFTEVIESGPERMKGINEAGLIAAIITAIKDQEAELSALRPNLSSFRVHCRKNPQTVRPPARMLVDNQGIEVVTSGEGLV